MRTTVTLLALSAATAGCGRTTPAAPDTPADAGPEAAADRAKLQGVWAVESLELPGGQQPAEERVKDVRFVFDGAKFRIAEQGRSYSEQFAFALDTTRKPKVMILTELGDDGTPYRAATAARLATSRAATFRGGTSRGGEVAIERQEWIYKFDGDALVIAFRAGRSGGRPTDFKTDAGSPPGAVGTARAGTSRGFDPGTPPTVVVRLKKTGEAPPAEPVRTFATARGVGGTRK